MKKWMMIWTVAAALGCGSSDNPGGPGPAPDAGNNGESDMASNNNVDPGQSIGDEDVAFDDGTFSVEAFEDDDGLRRYEASTTYQGLPDTPTDRTILERSDRPRLRSGSLAFDALFALAVQEADENAVEEISDGAFNDGDGVPCSCYETGAKWNYVWTRDTAYAADLGLYFVDPERVRRSLDFKLSERKSGGDLQIVQDTGTGGSWPVSTDRVSWTLGATAVARALPPSAETPWRERLELAVGNTVSADRDVVFDDRRGLYRGEQSFLDWREQSYPRWTATDNRHIAQSHALSTNLLHWYALTQAGLQTEADALRDAIDAIFWDEEAGLYRSMTATELHGAPLAKYDLLGNSLAVLFGFGDAERIVASYPYGPHGASVIWPQLPRIPIYHNRGQWPFVTAYALLAAGEAGNDRVFERNLDTLVRGAALNLSNMENFEFLSGHPFVEDGEFSGPVVNSRRQLWSVAGYIGAVVRGLFGVSLGDDVDRIAPFVTAALHRTYFPDSRELRLENMSVRGGAVDLVVKLPEPTGEGAYEVAAIEFSAASPLAEAGEITIELGPPAGERGTIEEVTDPSDFRNVFAPLEPTNVAVARTASGVLVTWSEPEPGVTYDVFRGSERVAADLGATSWTDPESTDDSSPCYAVTAKFPSGTVSHPSEPVCWFGTDGNRVQSLDVYTMANEGGAWSREHGRPHIGSWGQPSHAVEGAPFRPDWTGRHALQVIYGNGAGGFNTGIAAAVKKLVIENLTDGSTETRWVVMPQLAEWSRWEPSSVHHVELDSTMLYRWSLEDAFNMTYFSHFRSYTAGPGGGEEPFNAANIHALEFLPITGSPAPPPTRSPVPLNGVDDLTKYVSENVTTPGIALQSWSRFALDWDDDHLYATLVSQAFEDDFKPWMLYFGDGDPSTGSTRGLEYSGQTSELPFAADWVVSLRALSDDGTEAGPWNGIWAWDGQQWVRQRRLAPDRNWWLAANRHTISARIPRASLLGATSVQFAAHVVNAEPGNEWKEAVPATHTPWMGSATGYYVIDTNGPSPISAWGER